MKPACERSKACSLHLPIGLTLVITLLCHLGLLCLLSVCAQGAAHKLLTDMLQQQHPLARFF
jgi:hypothetical protein